MSKLTIPDPGEDLLRKLAARAKANHRSIEDEALCCVRVALETEEEALNSIPTETWAQVERSVCDTIQERGTPFSDADFERYRDIARGRNRS